MLRAVSACRRFAWQSKLAFEKKLSVPLERSTPRASRCERASIQGVSLVCASLPRVMGAACNALSFDHKFRLTIQRELRSLRSLQRPRFRKERAAHSQRGNNCDSCSFALVLCMLFSCVPSALERAASSELLAVLRVTLQIAAFIPSPLWRNNAQ